MKAPKAATYTNSLPLKVPQSTAFSWSEAASRAAATRSEESPWRAPKSLEDPAGT